MKATKRHTIYLSRKVSRALKRMAAETDREMSKIAEDALLVYLPSEYLKEAEKRVQSDLAPENTAL